ncbi:MAG TPA: PIN domain-containing protein [Terriglobales bacterium]|nr:PIN domain-containing protein [Terriglobales bacterium]
MILLDTNAVLWLQSGHPRALPLLNKRGRLYASPVSLLDLQLLVEVGRLGLKPGVDLVDLMHDDRWLMDDPPAVGWFERALALPWARDPFDRLLVAHAQFRGWRLATGDSSILAESDSSRCIEL